MESAKWNAQVDTNSLLLSLSRQSKNLSAAPLEIRVSKIDKGIGVRIFVGENAGQKDLILLGGYGDSFVVAFLGYLRTPTLQGTKKVSLSMHNRGANESNPLVTWQYSVERTSPGNFQVRNGNLVSPVIRKYPSYARIQALAAETSYSTQVHNQPDLPDYEILPHKGPLKVIVGTIIDLCRTLKESR